MQKFENTLWSGKCPFGEMSQWGNVESGRCPSGKCPVGELSVRGNFCRGSVRRESVSRGFVLGEVSVGEVSARKNVLQSILLCFVHHSFYTFKMRVINLLLLVISVLFVSSLKYANMHIKNSRFIYNKKRYQGVYSSGSVSLQRFILKVFYSEVTHYVFLFFFSLKTSYKKMSLYDLNFLTVAQGNI